MNTRRHYKAAPGETTWTAQDRDTALQYRARIKHRCLDSELVKARLNTVDPVARTSVYKRGFSHD